MPHPLPRPYAAYYQSLQEFTRHRATNEGATRHAFHTLLSEVARPRGLTLLGEQTIPGTRKANIRVDGLLRDLFFTRGIWEAKDTHDDLPAEISKKIASGYPLKNTLFEDTRRAVLYQHGSVAYEADLTDPDQLRHLLDQFLTYSEPEIEEFHKAVAEFKQRIPELALALTEIIDRAKTDNPTFRAALQSFLDLCREALNPATTPEEVEDMLKQHILTERIFRSIFHNPDFVYRNAVAVELEKMVKALAGQSFSRDAFLSRLDYFYAAIERAARTVPSYEEKQSLLNTLYEQFFQAYSTRAADTHGIVYTPREIVQWMVSSVERALQTEFGLSLSSPGVHIIDPCVGTGTFIMEILRRIPNSLLPDKYAAELHANEVLLLPYYIAAQNIEHAYFERTGQYAPFEGLCFADTLNMEKLQASMFAPANTERIARQNAAPIRVVIGNPPYNAWQVSENDDNKNRKYDRVDARIRETYVAASRATNRNALSDMYVKSYRWATDRLGARDGILCIVSNNSYLDQIAFDGMRKHLYQDSTRIYTFDLGGNVRKNPKLSGTRHNVFGIQVGVTITLLVRNSAHTTHELFYARLDEFWTNEQKLQHLSQHPDFISVEWEQLSPDARNTWLTSGLAPEFDSFLPLGSKEAKATAGILAESIFRSYTNGVKTNRDDWVYDFDASSLTTKVRLLVETYNSEIDRWRRTGEPGNIDNFVLYDDTRIKWSRDLKKDLTRKRYASFASEKLRRALYRPYTRKYYYLDPVLSQDLFLQPDYFPTGETEHENRMICVPNIGSPKPFHGLIASTISDLHLTVDTQCFPFYTYTEDGTERRENITDWALRRFQGQYNDPTITKWDIFHYTYAILHSPEYRARYAENLKRDLPRIPFVPANAFRPYVEAGTTLATLHRDYESGPRHTLTRLENPDIPFSWRVEKMRLSPDRTQLTYNPSLTLANIPPDVFNYRLGNRSALEWVIDQYRVSGDPRSGIRTDPNNPSDPQYILRLIEQVVHLSLQTVQIVSSLPPLALADGTAP